MLSVYRYIGVDRTKDGLILTMSPHTIIKVEEGVINTQMDVLKQPIKGKFNFEKNLIEKGEDTLILFQWVGRPTLSIPIPKAYIHTKEGSFSELEPKVISSYKVGRGRGTKHAMDLLIVVPKLPIILSDWDMTLIIFEDYELEFYVNLDTFITFINSLSK